MKKQPRKATGIEWSDQIRELVAAASIEAADRLADLAEGADRLLAKEARRALFALKRAGIVPSPREPAPEPAPAQALPLTAMASTIDGSGSQMLTFVRESQWGGSPMVIQFLVNYNEGVKDLFGRRIPRRTLDNVWAEMREGPSDVAPIPVDYARHLLQEATANRKAARKPLPDGYSDYAPQVGLPEAQYPRPLAYQLIEADSLATDPSISRDPEKLFSHEVFGPWLPDLKDVQPWVKRYAEAGESRIVLADHQKAQLGERVIDEATDALLGGGSLQAMQRRLEEQALVLHQAERHTEAREALYHAGTIRPDATPHMNPFARAYVRRAIVAIRQIAEEQAERQEAEEHKGLIQRV